MRKIKTLSFLTSFAVLGCAAGCTDRNEDKSSVPENKTEATTEAGTEAPVSAPEISGYDLLWNDEFSDEKLDESKWNYEPHEPGWTNNELQEYTTSEDNVFIRNGKLVLKAIKSDKNGSDYYTSGKVTGQNKTDFTYGKVVVSAKVPEGKGLWPAIWMMPKKQDFYGEWPRCGEIDIMEVLGHDVKTAYGTLHFGIPHGETQGTWGLTDSSFADSFHEFSVEWEPGEFRWYVDGNLFHTANDWFTSDDGEEEKEYPAPFNQPFFVQMNLAVGGDWPGNPDASTDFSDAEFEIDYVRVYQKPEYDMNVSKPEAKYREALSDGNFIYNGDFSESEDLQDDINWKFLLFNGGEGNAEIRDNMIVISSEKEGTEDYSVQLVQPELPMIKGKKYRVSFDAYADEERKIVVCVSAPTSGWIRYLKDTELAVTKEKQSYTYEFEMKDKDDPNGRLEFNLGHRGSTATVYISNVRVEEIK